MRTSDDTAGPVERPLRRESHGGCGKRPGETGWSKDQYRAPGRLHLAHRLGDSTITTIELDPALSSRARAALTTAGYHPTVVCGDGAAGVAGTAPYDRVISTVALPRVPPAWLEQTRHGALILIPLSFAGHGGLMALLARDATGGASGRFLAHYGGFMAVRSAPVAATPKIRAHLLETLRPTDVPPEALGDGHPAAFYLSLRCPRPYKVIQFTPDDDSTTVQTWGQGTDGSTFALIHTNGITQAAALGPLWDDIQAAYTQWHELGRPERDRFGITAGKKQWIWLDNHDFPIIEMKE